MRYSKHYTREQARALLPALRQWVRNLQELREQLLRQERVVNHLLAGGMDAGGLVVREFLTTRFDMERVMAEFTTREIEIKNLDRGLIDFPAIMAGREVFLCWELDEDDVDYWHELDSGYAGRELL